MSTTTELKLLPCPFCGGHADIGQVESDDCWSIGCDTCDFQLMTGEWNLGWHKSKDKAIAAWNTRSAAHGEPISASEREFITKRLRRVAKIVGLESAIPEGDDLIECAGSVLGMIASKLERQAGSAEQVGEREEDLYVINRLATILADVAIALKGPELPLHRHGYHDLAEKAQVLVLERDLLRHQVEELRAALQHTAPAPSKAGEWTDEQIVKAVHAAFANGRIALTFVNQEGIEKPTDVAKTFIRALSAPAQAQSEKP